MKKQQKSARLILQASRALVLPSEDSEGLPNAALQSVREYPLPLLDKNVLVYIGDDVLEAILQGDPIAANELTFFQIIKNGPTRIATQPVQLPLLPILIMM